MSYPPPPCIPHTLLSFPSPSILLCTLNRPAKHNALPKQTHWHLHTLWSWYDDHPDLRVAIITGAGTKAFCVGSDVLEIEEVERRKRAIEMGEEIEKEGERAMWEHPPGGFAGLSRRRGKKVVIAAVNGLAVGGGFEVVLNCDISISSPNATFSLPEPQLGLYAYGGGLPRLLHSTSLAVAMDIALTGRSITATEALHHGLISRISSTPESLLDETLQIARRIIEKNSPDAIVVTRDCVREAWERGSVEGAFRRGHERWMGGLMGGENVGVGLRGFREGNRPRWVKGKL